MTGLDPAAITAKGAARDLWAVAAVRERFKAGDILDHWLKTNVDADPAQRDVALTTTLAIQDAAVGALASDGTPALRLPESTRLQVLSEVGADDALAALATVPRAEVTLVERVFDGLLNGKTPPIEAADRLHLTALREAAVAAQAAGVALAFDPAAIDVRIRRLDLEMTLGGPDLARFVGRKEPLERLRQLWKEHGRDRAAGVEIEGPGGMGKSLLISKFVSELLAGSVEPEPAAIFHLDYDRRDLMQGSFSTLTSEVARQARQWMPPEEIDALLKDSVSGPDGLELEYAGLSRGSGWHASRGGMIGELARLLRRSARNRRILIIFDSLEQVLGFNDEAESAMVELIEAFDRGGIRPFEIRISRSFAAGWRSRDELERVNLGQFTDDEAKDYLAKEAAHVGVTLDAVTIDKVMAVVGRSPLALRLAIALMEKQGDSFDMIEWVRGLRDDPERIQAVLYDRILKRLRDRELIKVARPGLLVRRLSRDVIEQILAEPCALDLVKTPALDLLQRARREGQLFAANVPDADPSAIWHRADVRALMLPDLDATVSEAVAIDINTRAVAYYEQRDDQPSRVEELYHRLRLDQNEDQLDPRWVDGAGRQLQPALAELPPAAAAYVRRRIGAGSRGSITSGGGSIDMASAAELRGVVRRELQSLADGRDPLATLARYGADRPDGPLADLYVEALLSVGRIDELLAVAERVASDGWAPSEVRASVSNTAAAVLEGLERTSSAHDNWAASVAVAPTDTEAGAHIALSARVGMLRTARKLNEFRSFPGFKAKRAKQSATAVTLVEQLWSSLSIRPVAAREVVAELFDAPSSAGTSGPLMRLLANLVQSGEAFPSAIDDPARAVAIGERIGARVGSLRDLTGQASKMIFDNNGLANTIAVMRDEVDWTLRRAVKNDRSNTIVR